MDQEKLRSLIKEHKLSDFQSEIIANARPAVYISLDEAEQGEIGRSRIGGTPDLPPSIPWPNEPNWGYRCFLLQINFAELPKFESSPFPDTGMLYLFVNEGESDADQVIFYNGEESLQATVAPDADEMLTDWYDEVVVHTLKLEAGLDIPHWSSDAFEEMESLLGGSNENSDRLDELSRALSKGSVGRLLGYDEGIGQDVKENAYVVREHNSKWLYDYEQRKQIDMTGARKWRNLLLLYSNWEIELVFGDSGYLEVLVHADDLKSMDLSRAYVTLESS